MISIDVFVVSCELTDRAKVNKAKGQRDDRSIIARARQMADGAGAGQEVKWRTE